MEAAAAGEILRMDDAEGEPVSLVITWDVKPGKEREFEHLAQHLHDAAIRFPGHLGATWLRAEGSRSRYYTVAHFADQKTLDAWLRSPERREAVRRIQEIADESRTGTTGLETWFSLPGEAVPPPSKGKMIVVTFLGVYPISLLLQAFVTPRTQMWPLPVKALIFPVIVIPLLTVLVMPMLSRLFRRWLYPIGRMHRPARPGR